MLDKEERSEIKKEYEVKLRKRVKEAKQIREGRKEENVKDWNEKKGEEWKMNIFNERMKAKND